MDLITQLLKKLNDSEVRYVHWKSNTNIDDALSGKDDFDVLIAPEFRRLVESFFSELNITRANSLKDSWQNDIYHYIGLDSEYLKLAHIHVHYALPVGYDFDKNFILPIVNSYLEKPVKYKNVLIPEVEKEYIVLVVRLILKNSLTPFLLQLPTLQVRRLLNASKKGVVQGSGYREFLDLKERSNKERIGELLATDFSFVSNALFSDCEAVLNENHSLVEFFKQGKRLKRELKSYSNNSEVKSLLYSFLRINHGRYNKVYKKLTGKYKHKMHPRNGGKIVAFVGGDGAGKSTNIEKLKDKLLRHFWVETVHVGRPQKSFVGVCWKIASKIVRVTGFVDLAKALFYVAWAYDRKAAFNSADKMRRQGAIVILDRIPLPGITSMDCPRVKSVANGKFSWLAKIETKIYKKIKGVDMLFVFKLNPEVALRRRPEDDPDELRIRSGQIWNNDWVAPYAIEIDTGELSFTEVEQAIFHNVGHLLATPFIRTEILGVTGAGKSTLIANIAEKTPNLATAMPFYSFPIKSTVGVGRGLKTSFKVLLATNNFHVFKNSCQFFASIEIMKHWQKHGDNTATNYILDQGPLFQLSLLIKEGALNGVSIAKYKKIIDAIYAKCFFIDISDETLWQRVQSRKNHVGRGQDIIDQQVFYDFVNDYKDAFTLALSDQRNLININGNNAQPSELNYELQKHLDNVN